MRILHVVESFSGQATESWLTRLLRFEQFDSSRYQFDFFLIGRSQGTFAEAVLQTGANIVLGSPDMPSIPRLTKSLREAVSRTRYDVVHIHQDVLAGVFGVALVGSGARLVAHAHNCWQRLPVGGVLKARLLTTIARASTRRLSDAIVGVSAPALDGLTGGKKRRRRIDRVVHCSAADLGAVKSEHATSRMASELKSKYGFPEMAKLVLFVGRMDPYKNPLFAVKLLATILKQGELDVRLLFAGPQKLSADVQQAVRESGLDDRVKAAGWFASPGDIMRASDLVLVPSQETLSEGLGLVAVEAQACGVPVICSLSVPIEAQIVPSLFARVSLEGGPDSWARTARELLSREKYSELSARAQFEKSAFTDRASYEALAALYEDVYQGKIRLM